ncbi:hypothetical protein FRB95_011739 [Tulasnella sp. JGI-2019a]|nr:hypothetical protein FRB95_011739 [Tulasnella sp. JGI-2019a]
MHLDEKQTHQDIQAGIGDTREQENRDPASSIAGMDSNQTTTPLIDGADAITEAAKTTGEPFKPSDSAFKSTKHAKLGQDTDRHDDAALIDHSRILGEASESVHSLTLEAETRHIPSTEPDGDNMLVDSTPSTPKNGHLSGALSDEASHHDLAPSIDGLFRLLDLYSEESSSGLVDKIIIAEDSLKSLINVLAPGAHRSITKIDFAALDRIQIKVIGIYGSKTELVKFFCKIGIISDNVAKLLLLSDEIRGPSQSELRSGIYLLVPPNHNHGAITSGSPPVVYVVYWPEDTTWDDSAIGGVKRNRVTFMRYLTRLSDQIFALISPEHSTSLVWKDFDSDNARESDGSDGDGSGAEDDSEDRFFKFVVAKNEGQAESAKLHEGFELSDRHITGSSTPIAGGTILLAGHARQGFMTSQIIPEKRHLRKVPERMTCVRLAHLMRSQRVEIADTIDEAGLYTLFQQGGLAERFPELCGTYQEDVKAIIDDHALKLRESKAIAGNRFVEVAPVLEREVRREIFATLSGSYQMLHLDSVADDPLTPNISTISGVKQNSDHLRKLCKAYPKVKAIYATEFGKLDIDSIDVPGFMDIKRRFLRVRADLNHLGDKLADWRKTILIQNILSDTNIKHGISEDRSAPRRLWSFGRRILSTLLPIGDDEPSDDRIQHSRTEYDMPDAEFLDYVQEAARKEPRFIEAKEELYRLARLWAEQKLEHSSFALIQKISLAQQQGYDEQAELQSGSDEREDLKLRFYHFRDAVRAELVPVGSRSDLVVSSVRQAETGQCVSYQSRIFQCNPCSLQVTTLR